MFKKIGNAIGPIDLAAIPIGAYGAPFQRFLMKPGHMDPEEAVACHTDLNAKQSVGIHWGQSPSSSSTFSSSSGIHGGLSCFLSFFISSRFLISSSSPKLCCGGGDVTPPMTSRIVGTFRLTDEPAMEPKKRLGAAMSKGGSDGSKFTCFDHGETRTFPLRKA